MSEQLSITHAIQEISKGLILEQQCNCPTPPPQPPPKKKWVGSRMKDKKYAVSRLSQLLFLMQGFRFMRKGNQSLW